jgi:hypothetical protein
MALTPLEVARCWLAFAKEAFAVAPSRFSKDDLRSSVQAVDAWIDANQASYNGALPEPFKSTATATEKALLFMAVLVIRVRGE